MSIEWEVVGVIISIFGLGAVLISLWQVKKSLDASAITRLYGELHNIHSTFIEHPQHRPYFFYDAAITQEDPEYFRARSIAEMYLDIFEYITSVRLEVE